MADEPRSLSWVIPVILHACGEPQQTEAARWSGNVHNTTYGFFTAGGKHQSSSGG